MNSDCQTIQKEPEGRGLDTHQLPQQYTVQGNSSTRTRSMYLWEPLYQCDICLTTFMEKTLLENHKQIHVKEELYNDGAFFFGSTSMAASSKRFSGKNEMSFSAAGPNTCGVCNKKFSQKSSLNLHMRIHAGEKPYVCKECKKTFQTRCNLDKHVRTHTGDKPYTCEVCSRSFSQKESLKTHKRLHYNDRPFGCEICGKCFQTNGNLQVHKNVHTREKPFTCDICSKKFTQMGSLKTHKRSHSVDLPHNHSVDLPHNDSVDLPKFHSVGRPKSCETNNKEVFLIKQNFETLGEHMGKQSLNCNTCKKGSKYLHKLETHMCCHYGSISDNSHSLEPQPYQS